MFTRGRGHPPSGRRLHPTTPQRVLHQTGADQFWRQQQHQQNMAAARGRAMMRAQARSGGVVALNRRGRPVQIHAQIDRSPLTNLVRGLLVGVPRATLSELSAPPVRIAQAIHQGRMPSRADIVQTLSMMPFGLKGELTAPPGAGLRPELGRIEQAREGPGALSQHVAAVMEEAGRQRIPNLPLHQLTLGQAYLHPDVFFHSTKSAFAHPGRYGAFSHFGTVRAALDRIKGQGSGYLEAVRPRPGVLERMLQPRKNPSGKYLGEWPNSELSRGWFNLPESLQRELRKGPPASRADFERMREQVLLHYRNMRDYAPASGARERALFTLRTVATRPGYKYQNWVEDPQSMSYAIFRPGYAVTHMRSVLNALSRGIAPYKGWEHDYPLIASVHRQWRELRREGRVGSFGAYIRAAGTMDVNPTVLPSDLASFAPAVAEMPPVVGKIGKAQSAKASIAEPVGMAPFHRADKIANMSMAERAQLIEKLIGMGEPHLPELLASYPWAHPESRLQTQKWLEEALAGNGLGKNPEFSRTYTAKERLAIAKAHRGNFKAHALHHHP